MKAPRSITACLAAAAAMLVSQTGCERHPASQTVPGYAEKLAEKKARQAEQAATAETVDQAPPRFFPSGQQ